MVYRLNRTLLYGAAIVMLFATGFWSGVFRRRVLGPVLLLAMLLVTFIPSGIEFYELVSVSIMVLLIGMNILSIVLAMFKNTDDEEKSFVFGVGVTLILTLLIHTLPAIIIPEVIMDRSTPGITPPLCMFWFLVTNSIIKEMSRIRVREKKEAEKMMMQQEHVFKNMGEGFFRVGREGLISNVLTDVCSKIFGRDITGEKLTELLSIEEDTEFLEELMLNFFQ